MEFDYNKYKVVGVAEGNVHNDNAIIKPVGYLDPDQSWKFIPLSEKEIEETFPSRGSIFAYRFKIYQSHFVDKCIGIGIKPSNNDGKDEYIWDYHNGAPDEYAIVIKKLTSDTFSGSPDSIYDYCDTNDWLNNSEKIYRFHKDKIYCIDPQDISKRYIKYWDLEKLKQTQQLYSTIDKKYYVFLGNDINAPASHIDIMPNSELKEWLIKQFLIPEWGEVLSNDNITELEDSIRKVTLKCKWPEDILRPRIERAIQTFEDVILSVSEIKKLQRFPNLESIINKSIKDNGETILKEISSSFSKELEKLKKSYEKVELKEKELADFKISEIQEKLENEKKNYLRGISELENKKLTQTEIIKNQDITISKKQTEIAELNSKLQELSQNKNNVLENFGVIKDVLELMNCSPNTTYIPCTQEKKEVNINIKTLNCKTNPFKAIDVFVKYLEGFLTQNNQNPEIAKKILGFIIHYKTLVIPDIRIVLSILQATGKCNYIIQYVTPEWRSFNKVWENGLSDIVDKCAEDLNVINYLILQNVNLTYLPCILQPIVDICLGLINTFPDTKKSFPKNLRIILTTTQEEALPLAIQNLRYFGCLKNEDYTIDDNKEIEINSKEDLEGGYLSMNMIKSLEFTPSPSSEFKSYMSEYEE